MPYIFLVLALAASNTVSTDTFFTSAIICATSGICPECATFPLYGIGAIKGPSVSNNNRSNGTILTDSLISCEFLNVITPVNPIKRFGYASSNFCAKTVEPVKQ